MKEVQKGMSVTGIEPVAPRPCFPQRGDLTPNRYGPYNSANGLMLITENRRQYSKIYYFSLSM